MTSATSAQVDQLNHTLKQIAKSLQVIAIVAAKEYDRQAKLEASSRAS